MARIREKTLKFPGLNNTYTFADEADLFDANVDCAVGEYRIYNGDLYCCTTAHTGAWDASHFKAVKMGNEVSGLKTAITQIKGVAYKKGDNLIDFGFLGNTWIQGAWDNGTLPYICHTVPIDIPEEQSKIYIAFNKSRFETETGYDSAGTVLVVYFDENDTKLGQNSASTQYQGPYEETIPSGTSYIVVQISTSVWGNSLTPAMLDSVTNPFAYAGYQTVSLSDIPTNNTPYPENNDERITTLEANVATITSDSATINSKLNDASIFEKSDTPETLTQGGGYYQTDGTLFSPTSTEFLHYDLAVSGGDKYSITGFFSQDSRFVEYIFFDASNGVISYAQASEDGNATVEATVPSGAVKMGINSYASHTAVCYKYEQENTQEYIAEQASYWYGKKIVWFGTSIRRSCYPEQIGEMIGGTVYNECYGSSCARGGSYHAITENDPMGWAGMQAIQVMLSLSLSQAEKQSVINNWDSKWKDIIADPETYDSTKTADYLATSWDVKLSKYLTGGSVGQCDLYVFDHGYNDHVQTYGFSDMSEVPSSDEDRTYWIGAMNFLVKKILEDNPKAHILIIGHYNNEGDQFNRGANWNQHYVCEAQKKYATMWGLSCVPTWELLGLSVQTITVNGSEKTMIEVRYPDKLHPSSDTSGAETHRYAEALLPYVNLARGS